MSVVTDVLTLDATKRAIRAALNTSVQDDRYEGLITGASQWLDRMCGPVVRRTVTEYHDGGQPWIWMRACPLSSITSVAEYVAGTSTTVTAESVSAAGGYLAEADSTLEPAGLLTGRLWRRYSFAEYRWASGRGNIAVTAVAGRYATTAAVAGSRFEQAALILVKWLAQTYATQVAQPGGYDVPFPATPRTVPLAVQQLLAEDWRVPLAVG